MIRKTVLAVGLSAVLMATGASAAEPLVLGLFGPMSGERAALGTRFREAALMYAEEINAAGGINGRPLEIRPEDSRGAPREAANIAQKFAQDPDVIAVIGGQSSTESMAAAPILAEAGMPQVSPTASHPDFTKISNYQFRISNTQATLANVHADLIANTMGFKRVAIIYFQDDWGAFVNSSTTAALEDLGVEVVMSEAMIPEGRDYRALVTKVLAAQPDGVFLASHYSESAVFVMQMRQAAPDMPIASTDTLIDPKFIELSGGAAEGVIMPTPFLPDAPAAAAFTQAFEAKYSKPADYYAAFAYDAVMVVAKAIEDVMASGQEVTRQTVRDAIANAPVREGVSGRVEYGELGDPEMRMMSLVIVKDGAHVAYPAN